MEPHEREELVARVLAGIIPLTLHGHTWLCREPEPFAKHIASVIPAELAAATDYYALPSHQDVVELMVGRNLWTGALEEELKTLEENTKKLKLGIFQSGLRSNDRKTTKKALEVTKKRHQELLAKRHALDYLTRDHIFGAYRQYSLLYYSLCDEEGHFLHKWPEKFPFEKMDKLLELYFRSLRDEKDYRLIARTDPWQTVWHCGKNESGVFGLPSCRLSIEQRVLSSWAMHYENVRQCDDPPADWVVADDDAMDGWLIARIKKRKQDENESAVDALITSPKVKNSQEVYIVTQTKEDAEVVDSLNSPVAKAIKKQRLAAIEKHGMVNEMEFADVQQRLAMEMNQHFARAAGG